jgi:formyl-CoA transferase
MGLPLEGLTVIDLSRALAGPYCTMMLGDLGADIIKVEEPGNGDLSRSWGPPFVNGESAYFLSINRNKRSVTLNLKNEEAKKILWRLIATGDVLVENFPPGTAERLGFGYSIVHEANPRLVYCSISGFGQSGPYRSQPAFDQILQGLGGLMSLTGEKDGPPTRVGVPIVDITSGMFAAYATMAALYSRAATGQGQQVDTSLLGSELALLTYQAGRFFATGESPERSGNRHPTIAPYEYFHTADGYVNVACGTAVQWPRFCDALGLHDFVEDARFATNKDRLAHRDELATIIEAQTTKLPTAEVVKVLEAAGVPCGPILNLQQVFEHPQVEHLGLKRTIDHPSAGPIDVVQMPFQLSETPGSIRKPPPLLGQHTEEVLSSIGYSSNEIETLRQVGAI